MISDLDENEDDSERAVEMLGLKGVNDLGPSKVPQTNDASFGQEQAAEPEGFESNYSG